MTGDILGGSKAPAFQLPALGDTPFPYMTASARDAAGVRGNWDESVPVVFNGDGTQTAGQLNGPVTLGGRIDNTPKASDPGYTFGQGMLDGFGFGGDWINRPLVALAGIVLLGVGAYFLIRE